MVRLLLCLIVLFGVGYVVVERGGSSGASFSGGDLVLDREDLEARFRLQGTVSESYMIFGGGRDDRHRNSFANVTYATLGLREAAAIHARYPDFHRCASPGSHEAKRLIQTTSLVAADRATARTLGDALDLHEQRVGSGGDRTCVTVRGSRIELSSVKVKENGEDITSQVVPRFRQASFRYIESAEIADCHALLARSH